MKTLQRKQYSAPEFEFVAYEQTEAIAVTISKDLEDDRDAVIVW